MSIQKLETGPYGVSLCAGTISNINTSTTTTNNSNNSTTTTIAYFKLQDSTAVVQ